MAYTVVIDTKAAREIRALPKREQVRVFEKIQSLAQNPHPPGSVKLAGSSDLWRIRSGSYRIIYQIQDERLLITVLRVGHRRDLYRS